MTAVDDRPAEDDEQPAEDVPDDVRDGWWVTTPGLVDGMPDDVYHADPVPEWSLSSTGARRIFPQPGAPARYRWLRDNPEPHRPVLDRGKALHARVLGTGTPWCVPVDEDGDPYVRWDTNRCKAQIEDIRAAGHVPLKPDDALKVEQMAERILDHPDARALLEDTAGRAEVSGFARDPATGAWLRCRYDYLPDTDGRLLLFPDLKSTADASDAGCARAIGEYGYHRQGDFYIRVARLLGLAERVGVVLVMQETDPPYLVNVVTPDAEDMTRARLMNDEAIRLFADCKARDHWPGYPAELHTVAVPSWRATFETQELNR